MDEEEYHVDTDSGKGSLAPDAPDTEPPQSSSTPLRITLQDLMCGRAPMDTLSFASADPADSGSQEDADVDPLIDENASDVDPPIDESASAVDDTTEQIATSGKVRFDREGETGHMYRGKYAMRKRPVPNLTCVEELRFLFDDRKQPVVHSDLLAQLEKIPWKHVAEQRVRRLLSRVHGELSDVQWKTARKQLDRFWNGEDVYSGDSLLEKQPFGYWMGVHKNDRDPQISDLALRLHSAPATEACCERCFSQLRLLLTKHRRRLLMENARRRLTFALRGEERC
jgi:hypothetical protein